MTREERRERIRRQVDDWPPFTPQQSARLAVLLRPEPQAVETPVRRSTESKAA
ncbi:hypothetical protein QF032_001347 [Streptomyces achromogenes]|uniref:hypothetical protein n=1 Tax=Streptomyces achromogenes TaxID=67255 RepID=UPI00278869B1|nr:hypothetical protein [Streptomyces achromogenes]MDQ0829503.1 hypothetical protein [Streptomyces achromogenes]